MDSIVSFLDEWARLSSLIPAKARRIKVSRIGAVLGPMLVEGGADVQAKEIGIRAG